MSIRDEARQEAERRWPTRAYGGTSMNVMRREDFEAGAVWASERVDREPSDAEVRRAEQAEGGMADPVTLGRIAWEAVHDHGAFARDFPDDAYYRAVGEAIAHGEVRDVS